MTSLDLHSIPDLYLALDSRLTFQCLYKCHRRPFWLFKSYQSNSPLQLYGMPILHSSTSYNLMLPKKLVDISRVLSRIYLISHQN